MRVLVVYLFDVCACILRFTSVYRHPLRTVCTVNRLWAGALLLIWRGGKKIDEVKTISALGMWSECYKGFFLFIRFKMRQHRRKNRSCNRNPKLLAVRSVFVVTCHCRVRLSLSAVVNADLRREKKRSFFYLKFVFYFQFVMIIFSYLSACLEIITLSACGWLTLTESRGFCTEVQTCIAIYRHVVVGSVQQMVWIADFFWDTFLKHMKTKTIIIAHLEGELVHPECLKKQLSYHFFKIIIIIYLF